MDDTKWLQRYQELIDYKEQNGDTLVNTGGKGNPDKSLGYWVNRQRTLMRKGKIRADRLQLLNEIEFAWDPWQVDGALAWMEQYDKLVAYKIAHGDMLVPYRYEADKSLSIWVEKQRRDKRKKKLRADREQMLDQIGFVWMMRRRGREGEEDEGGEPVSENQSQMMWKKSPLPPRSGSTYASTSTQDQSSENGEDCERGGNSETYIHRTEPDHHSITRRAGRKAPGYYNENSESMSAADRMDETATDTSDDEGNLTGNSPATKDPCRPPLSRKRRQEATAGRQTCSSPANKRQKKRSQASKTKENRTISHIAPSNAELVGARLADCGSDGNGEQGMVDDVASWIIAMFTNKGKSLPPETTLKTYAEKLVKFGLVSANHLDDAMEDREYFDSILSEEIGMTGWDRRVLIGPTTTAIAANGNGGSKNKGVLGSVTSWIRTMFT